jgi:glycerophosphoryl diester phosphodiesterase
MALNISVECTFSQAFKNIFKIERPWVQDSRIEPVSEAVAGAGGYSFPSGHTARATAVWGALGAYLWKCSGKVLSAVCWAIVVLVAFSRNYLGVHTLKDVLAAFAVGLLFVYIFEKVLTWVEKGSNRDVIVAVIVLIACFVPMLKVGCISNAGAGMGIVIGWVIERHFIGFEIEGKWHERCVRFAVGCFGMLLIYNVSQSFLNLFMESKYAGFFTMFALGLFIMAGYPFFFLKRQRYKLGIVLAVLATVILSGVSYGWHRHLNRQIDDNSATSPMETISENEIIEVSDTIPLVIAHRGYSAVFPENTLSSFEGAIDIGADFIELDVQLTRDGQVVVFHDDSLERITGVEGAINDFTYDELLEMDAGSWFSTLYADEKIPTLLQVLELVSSSECKVYLELKDMGDIDGFEEAVLSVVRQAGMIDRCVFASFNYDYLEYFKNTDENIKTLYNTTSDDILLPIDYPADYYGLYVEAITGQLVAAVHDAGSYAFVWTVNTPTQMHNVQEMGVDGIVTNYPGMALALRTS